MSKKTYNSQRSLGYRRYSKLFVVCVEGSKTEPQYFDIFNSCQSHAVVKCLRKKATNSSPTQVLNRMKTYLKKEPLKKGDEAWIVVDKDDWTEDQIKELLDWSSKSVDYEVAINNPNFEYWLLLHFEDGNGLKNPQECLTRLKKYLKNYRKEVDPKKIPIKLISRAIGRAKQRDTKRDTELPHSWSTTVYKLVERILSNK